MNIKELQQKARNRYNGMIYDTGYEPFTTFWSDFEIVEVFGIDAIKDTYNRCFKSWKGDYKYLTELCMILNWKVWAWVGLNDDIARVYDNLYQELDTWCLDNLKDDELSYFIRTLD